MTPESGNPTGSETAAATTTVNPNPGSPAPNPGTTDWRAGFTDPALRADPSLGKFKDPEALAKSYKAMEAYQGRSVAIPGKDARPEEKAAFDSKVRAYLGVPESADQYELKAPEGVEFDPGLASNFKGMAHQLGLSQGQMSGLVSWFMGSPMGNPTEAHRKMGEMADRELRAEWGGAFDLNMKFAQRSLREVGGQDMHALMEQTGLGNHPTVIRFFHRLGKEYAEDGTWMRDLETGGLMTPDKAKAEIQKILNDKTHAYHRGDKDAVAAVRELYQAAHPSS